MFKCIKYSYKSGNKQKRTVIIKKNSITYKKLFSNNYIEIDKIKGIAYGPRTITFNMVNECMPWLITSIITEERTYDFEFKTLCSLKRFISMMHQINHSYNNKMIIPQLQHIEMDSIWMQHHTNRTTFKLFRTLKWNNWFNNRTRKYKIITHKNNDECCSICLDGYEDNHFVCQLCCGHTFHIECIASWFKRSFTCPLCRISIS